VPLAEDAPHLRVAVVGAGFGGLGFDPDEHLTTPRRPAEAPGR
jgi:hypothetical protein